jgi:hypothetical protein
MPATHSLVLLELSDRAVFPLRQGLPTMGFVDDISREGVSGRHLHARAGRQQLEEESVVLPRIREPMAATSKTG